MSMITEGASDYVVIEKNQKGTSEERALGEGTELNTTYFEVRVSYAITGEPVIQEVDEKDLLIAAERAGTFQFLDAAEEDGYNDLLKKRE